ncbi:hypothetical protein LINPERPRIM_LOCUS3601 [Linum perenne]
MATLPLVVSFGTGREGPWRFSQLTLVRVQLLGPN